LVFLDGRFMAPDRGMIDAQLQEITVIDRKHQASRSIS